MKYHPSFWKFLIATFKEANKELAKEAKNPVALSNSERITVRIVAPVVVPIVVYREWKRRRKPYDEAFIDLL